MTALSSVALLGYRTAFDERGHGYTLYELRLSTAAGSTWSVEKRFTEFKEMALRLAERHKAANDASLPPPPEMPKSIVSTGWFGGHSLAPEFVEKRAKGLHTWLQALLSSLPSDDPLLVEALEGQISQGPQQSAADVISSSLVAYSQALQLEFHDKELMRWTEAELLRRRTNDLTKLQDVVVHSASLVASARNGAVKMCGQRLVEIAEELIALRYKRSAEMQQQVLTLTVSVQVWVQVAALFFGVLLLETGSATFNFMLCTFTILSISLALWTIADMDLPFSSNFHRVKFESLSIKVLAKPKPPKPPPSSRRPSASAGRLKGVVSVIKLGAGTAFRAGSGTGSGNRAQHEQGAACLSVGFAANRKRALDLSRSSSTSSSKQQQQQQATSATTTSRSVRIAPCTAA